MSDDLSARLRAHKVVELADPRDLAEAADRIDALEAEVDLLREALEQAQPWLHYLRDHIAPEWSRSQAEVLRQDVALVDTRLADSVTPETCPTCGGSGGVEAFDGMDIVRHGHCPDCTEEENDAG